MKIYLRKNEKKKGKKNKREKVRNEKAVKGKESAKGTRLREKCTV